MNQIHIVGRKNHGKTTLIVDLVRYLKDQGLCIGTIKHTHHHHQIDTPGKDSFQHREAGADVVGILSPGTQAAFWTPPGGTPEANYRAFEPFYQPCDLVLVEGDAHATAPRIEVWRAALGTLPIATEDPRIAAIVTDDAVAWNTLKPTISPLARNNVPQIAKWILRHVREGT